MRVSKLFDVSEKFSIMALASYAAISANHGTVRSGT
jgi:hypothetical protein